MKCFYSGAEAVGVCRACGRGLSLAHATEFDRGLACKNRCEGEAQRWFRLIELDGKIAAISDSLDRRANGNAAVSAVFSILAGAGFIYFTGAGGGLNLTTFMGGAFILYGAYSLVRIASLARRARLARASNGSGR